MQKSKTLLLLSGILAFTLGFSGSALAQAEGSAPPPAAASSSGSSSAGSGGAGIGVGAVAWLAGPVGAEVVYDAAVFHVGGTIGLSSGTNGGGMPRGTSLFVGASGWYHLHRGASSDFSAGGGLGFLDGSGGGVTNQTLIVEPGVLARVFVTSNVAISGRVGLTMAFGDVTPATNNPNGGRVQSSSVALNGQINGALGFTYFFR
jgi:hypothetical protein